MDRAKVIIHMYMSIDGKIDGDWDGLPGDKISGDYYDDQLFRLGSANANGSNTIVMYAAKGHPDLSKYDGQKIEYRDWVPSGIKAITWDVSYDRRGRPSPSWASTRMTARLAVEPPVIMLRVYCSCPGVSAMMNLRLLVEK